MPNPRPKPRPPRDGSPARSLSVRFSPTERALLTTRARVAGLTLAAYIRRKALQPDAPAETEPTTAGESVLAEP